MGDTDAWELAGTEHAPSLTFHQERADRWQLVDFLTLSLKGSVIETQSPLNTAVVFSKQLLCR